MGLTAADETRDDGKERKDMVTHGGRGRTCTELGDVSNFWLARVAFRRIQLAMCQGFSYKARR